MLGGDLLKEHTPQIDLSQIQIYDPDSLVLSLNQHLTISNDRVGSTNCFRILRYAHSRNKLIWLELHAQCVFQLDKLYNGFLHLDKR